jgi:hypothetical protein
MEPYSLSSAVRSGILLVMNAWCDEKGELPGIVCFVTVLLVLLYTALTDVV